MSLNVLPYLNALSLLGVPHDEVTVTTLLRSNDGDLPMSSYTPILFVHLMRSYSEGGGDPVIKMLDMLSKGRTIDDVYFSSPIFKEAAYKAVGDDLILKSEELQVTSQHKCKQCGSMKTREEAKQTRSSDEAQSTFVFCLNCRCNYQIS